MLKWNRNKSALGSNSDAAFIQYQIYKDGTNVAQTTNSFFTLTGLTNGTSYSIQVSAKNTSTGIEGAKSKSISIKPRYLGPKWYVAASNGYALNDTASNFNTGLARDL